MKIVYIVSRYPQISETFIAREIKQLIELGNQVEICRIRNSSKKERKQGIKVKDGLEIQSQANLFCWISGIIWAIRTHRDLKTIVSDLRDIPIFTKNYIKLCILLLCSIAIAQKIEKHDILHIRANFLHSEAVCAMWVSHILNIPYSLTVHTRVIFFPKVLIQKCLQDAVFCVCISQDAKRFIEESVSKPNQNYLIRNGVDLKEMVGNSSKCGHDKFHIVAVGRLIKKKGFDNLIKACNLLNKQGYFYHCFIVGDGPQRAELYKLTKDLDLTEQVSFLGALPFSDIIDIYRNVDLLAMPSRIDNENNDFDGIPTVLIEAMAIGLPVIATPVGGIPELIKDEFTGLLIEPENPNDITEKIIRMSNDRNLYEYLRGNALDIIRNEYDIRKNCEVLNSCINQFKLLSISEGN